MENDIEDGEIPNSDNDDEIAKSQNNFIKKCNNVDFKDEKLFNNPKPEASTSRIIEQKKSNEQDEDEILYIRGGSPRKSSSNKFNSDHNLEDEYDKEISGREKIFYHQYDQFSKEKKMKFNRIYSRKSKQLKNQKKSELENLLKRKKLCKFFLKNDCYRPSQCAYMHSDFPCKYHYLGLECPDNEKCKLSHGKPLTSDMKEALLRHIQYAPEECLENFKKIPNEVAVKLFEERDKILKSIERSSNEKLKSEVVAEIDDMSETPKIETIPFGFADINELANVELSNSIKTENYDDSNFKFLLIQFLLSLNGENSDKKNVKYNNIPKNLCLENYKEFLKSEQIEKLNMLGIHFVHHLCLLSVASLNKLGISVAQLSEIQDKSLNIENVKLNSERCNDDKCDTDKNVEGSIATNDTDMRILPAIFDSNIWPETKNADYNLVSPTPSDQFNDEESELIIDETVIPDEESEYVDTQENGLSSDDMEIEDVTESISFNEKFKKTENEAKLIANQNTHELKTKNSECSNDYELSPSSTEIFRIHKLSDLDMRYPFTPVMLGTVPATEINGSINMHKQIAYKLMEVLVPEKKIISINKLSPNNIDPRLRIENIKCAISASPNSNNDHLISTNNLNSNEDINKIENVDDDNKENFTKIENSFPILDIDPRKRINNYFNSNNSKDNRLIHTNENSDTITNSSEMKQQPNILLHYFLHKSCWYNLQNSKIKIEINALIAYLIKEIKDYHNKSDKKQFNIQFLKNSDKIENILNKLEICIDCNGNIIEKQMKTQQSISPSLPPSINSQIQNDNNGIFNIHNHYQKQEIFNPIGFINNAAPSQLLSTVPQFFRPSQFLPNNFPGSAKLLAPPLPHIWCNSNLATPPQHNFFNQQYSNQIQRPANKNYFPKKYQKKRKLFN